MRMCASVRFSIKGPSNWTVSSINFNLSDEFSAWNGILELVAIVSLYCVSKISKKQKEASIFKSNMAPQISCTCDLQQQQKQQQQQQHRQMRSHFQLDKK